MTAVPAVTLNDGNTIPQLGLGVFRVNPSDTERVVSDALELGYRHIDTASFYQNEAGVGAAVRKSGIPRDEIFVTTKLWNSDQGPRRPFDAIDRSLQLMGLDRVDLYLIHWPVPSLDLFVETWQAFESIRESGKVTSIGVSNFREQDLDRIARHSSLTPAVNQIEVHPLLVQEQLRGYDASHGIATESWGPLGHGSGSVLASTTVVRLAADHDVRPAQVILRWHIQHGLTAIPKSTNHDRMRQNLDIFGFELGAADMAALDSLDSGTRFGPNPANL